MKSFSEIVDQQGYQLISPQATDDAATPELRRLGDVNHDGFEDFAIWSREFNDPNSFFVVLGAGGGFSDVDFDGIEGGVGFESRIELPDNYRLSDFDRAGDINGDDAEDLVVVATLLGENETPLRTDAFVVFGGADGVNTTINADLLDGDNGFVFRGAAGGFAAGGDLNGDGFDDLALNMPVLPGDDAEVIVVFGALDGFDAELTADGLAMGHGFTITASHEDEILRAGRIEGNVNGDGIDDILLRGKNMDINTKRSVFVVFGGESIGAADIDLETAGQDVAFDIAELRTGSQFGFNVVVLDDFNGDGVSDFAISAERTTIGNESMRG